MLDLTEEKKRRMEALMKPEDTASEERAGRHKAEELPSPLPSPSEKAPQAVVVVASKQKEEAGAFRQVADSGKVVWNKTHFVFVLDCSGTLSS